MTSLPSLISRKDHITNEILATGEFYEADLLRYLRQRAHHGTCIDIGAYCGTHSVAFSLAMPSTCVVAIESNPQAVEFLRTNAKLSPKITVVHAAIHDQWDGADIVPGPSHNSGMTQVREGKLIACHSLDALSIEGASVLKIDVEGLELPVLRSAHKVLSQRSLRDVVVEVSDATEIRVMQWLAEYGFEQGRCFNSTPTYIYTRKPL